MAASLFALIIVRDSDVAEAEDSAYSFHDGRWSTRRESASEARDLYQLPA